MTRETQVKNEIIRKGYEIRKAICCCCEISNGDQQRMLIVDPEK